MERRKFLRLFGAAAAVVPVAAVAAPGLGHVLAKTGTMSREDAMRLAYMEKLVNPPLLASMSYDFPNCVPGGVTYVED